MGGGGVEARGCSQPCSRLPTPDLICPLTPPSCRGNPLQEHRGGRRQERAHLFSRLVGQFLFIQLSQVTLITLTQAGPRLAPNRSTSSPETSPSECRHRWRCGTKSSPQGNWSGLFWPLYLGPLGMAVSACTASFIPTVKVRKYLSSFMALPINGEASYHRRIKISNEIVQWKLCLLN